MASFKNGDVEIAYLDEGEGEPIVLVHGFASTKEVNWVNPGWVRTLTGAGRRVIALDNRGHGQSSKLYDPAEYHSSKMADDVRALLDHLKIERADVMGYSMGARIAAFLTINHPERVRSIVLGGLGDRMVKEVGLPATWWRRWRRRRSPMSPIRRGGCFVPSPSRPNRTCARSPLASAATRQTLSREQVGSNSCADARRGRNRGYRRRQCARTGRADSGRPRARHPEPRPHAGGRRQGVQNRRTRIP